MHHRNKQAVPPLYSQTGLGATVRSHFHDQSSLRAALHLKRRRAMQATHPAVPSKRRAALDLSRRFSGGTGTTNPFNLKTSTHGSALKLCRSSIFVGGAHRRQPRLTANLESLDLQLHRSRQMHGLKMQRLKVCEIMGERLDFLVTERVRNI
jgi:hypothetical protein